MTILTATGSTGMGSMLITLVLMLAVFYFMLIRPENKRKKEAEQMRSAVKTGDKITTSTVDNLGYGYLGMSANRINVAGKPGSDASGLSA